MRIPPTTGSNTPSPAHKREPEHGLTYLILYKWILFRAAHTLTPGKLLAIPHMEEDYACLEFRRNVWDEEIQTQKLSESEQLVYLSLIGMPISNLWVQASIQRNILSRHILDIPPEYIGQRNDYIFENYENQFSLTSRENTLLPEYALHLGLKYSLHALQNEAERLTSGRILFLTLPFVAAALRDFPLDIYTQDPAHAGIQPYIFAQQLLSKIKFDELNGDQVLLYKEIKKALI